MNWSLNISLSLHFLSCFLQHITLSRLSLSSGHSWFYTVGTDNICRACFDWLCVLSLSILPLSLMAFCAGWRGLRRDWALSQCCHLQKRRLCPHHTPDAISPRAEGIPSAAKSMTANGKPERVRQNLRGRDKRKNERDRFIEKNWSPGVKER